MNRVGAVEPWPSFLEAMSHIAIHSFGGPVAQIAVVHEEVVEKRSWIDDETFARLLSFANVLPGPEALELVIHIGYLRRGITGGIVAGLFFIAPGVVSLTLLAWLYSLYGSTHLLTVIQGAIRPVAIGLVLAAALRLSRKLLTTASSCAIGAGALLASHFLGVPFAILLIAGAVVGVALPPAGRISARQRAVVGILLIAAALLMAAGAASRPQPVPSVAARQLPSSASLFDVALLNLKTALVTFGGAYTALPYLRDHVVERGWLPDGAMLDALALGETTPGPLISIAVFVSYLIGGFPGAMIGAFFLFLPSFVLVLGLARWVERITSFPLVARALEGVLAATIGLILALTADVAGGIASIAGGVIAAAAFAAVSFFRVSPAVVVVVVTASMIAVDALV